MRRIRLTMIAAALALVSAGAVAGYVVAQSGGGAAVRTPLAQSTKVKGAKGRTLGLSRVTIPAGGTIALHHHEGTQVAYIQAGVLTYTVRSGSVTVMTGPGDDGKVARKISGGQTGKIHAGQWIVEQPSTIHRAANKGRTKIVIYLATLLKKGAPPSTPNPSG
ncbi:MAG TPA: cupin domain-containing protein [Solirubrobacterales bacterium]|nr:cupin domain-containing protein [Solirubrobacterales bacterium]